MPPPGRWQLQFEEAFWESVIQLPGWPASWRAVLKLLADISSGADQGDRVPNTFVLVRKTVAVRPDNDEIVRLVAYYTISENPDVATLLFVDDYDADNDPWDRPHAHRLPDRWRNH